MPRKVIWRTKLLKNAIKGVPGRIALKQQDGVVVLALDCGILVTEIKIDEEREVIPAKDYFQICGWRFECGSY